MSWCRFLWTCHIWAFLSILNLCVCVCLLAEFGKFSGTISLNAFQVLSSFSYYPPGTLMAQMLGLLLLSHRALSSFQFICRGRHLFSIVIYIVLAHLSFFSSVSYWTIEVFISVIVYFFSSKIFICSSSHLLFFVFDNFYIFAETFYLSIWYRYVREFLLKYFYDGCFKSV